MVHRMLLNSKVRFAYDHVFENLPNHLMLDGVSATLPLANIRSAHRVGDTKSIWRPWIALVGFALHLKKNREVFLVDAVGKMEYFSTKFTGAMTDLLDSDRRR